MINKVSHCNYCSQYENLNILNFFLYPEARKERRKGRVDVPCAFPVVLMEIHQSFRFHENRERYSATFLRLKKEQWVNWSSSALHQCHFTLCHYGILVSAIQRGM